MTADFHTLLLTPHIHPAYYREIPPCARVAPRLRDAFAEGWGTRFLSMPATRGRTARRPTNTAKARRGEARPTDAIVIPEKLYFRIGEVSDLCRLPASVLRFWETEFPQLKPTKSNTGQRMYRRADVEHVLQIKELLYTRGFTISGARQALREESRNGKHQPPLFPAGDPAKLKAVRNALAEVLTILERKR
jgi:DNA-binding transcriptional MerR regulator